jgi:hypothetical protein
MRYDEIFHGDIMGYPTGYNPYVRKEIMSYGHH